LHKRALIFIYHPRGCVKYSLLFLEHGLESRGKLPIDESVLTTLIYHVLSFKMTTK